MSRRVIGASGETPTLIAVGDINAHHSAWEEGAKNDDRSVLWYNFLNQAGLTIANNPTDRSRPCSKTTPDVVAVQ